MRFAYISVAIAAASCRLTAPASPDLARIGARGLHAIDGGRLEQNTKLLSSDELAGREPGSPGGAKAEDLVAAAFASAGLEPGGEHGTFFQTVPLREAKRDDAKTTLAIHGKTGEVAFAENTDVVLFADPHRADVQIDAPLAFVGYGFATNGYDDLAGLDLHGAVAVIFGGAPRTLAGKPVDAAEHGVLSDTKKRTLALRAHGASAVLIVFDPARAVRMPFETWRTKVLDSSMAWLDERGEVGSLPVLPTGFIGEAGLDKMLTAANAGVRAHALWEKLDRGEPVKLELAAQVSLHIHAELTNLKARNVIGFLAGSDPKLSAETVVYTAHLDHLGFGPPVNGDPIYNGALDDAIGVAGLVELAHAFAALPQRPRRTILFIAVTGEEKGLLGSDYFVKQPTAVAGNMVANINIDGLNPLYESFDMVPIGAEHSSLWHDAEAAARATGYALTPDPEPEQVYFIRSDQYSFAQAGIPAVFPGAGWRDAHGDTKANEAISNAWSDVHYHQPSDEWRPEYKGAWAAKEAGFDFLLGLSVAIAPDRPHWNPGDAFGITR